MKIYLDLCAIQRPLDTSNQIRIALESEAVLGIISLSDQGKVELLSSEALRYEGDQSPLPVRREHTMAVLAMAKTSVSVTQEVQSRAQSLVTFGFKPLDSIHVALAESASADFFCTCDDDLLRRSKRVKDLRVNVVNPVDLVQEIEK